jgi:hypothetical protein
VCRAVISKREYRVSLLYLIQIYRGMLQLTSRGSAAVAATGMSTPYAEFPVIPGGFERTEPPAREL